MMKFLFKRLLFRICEMAFASYNDSRDVKCDVINLYSTDEEDNSINDKYCVSRFQHTLLTDLTLDEVELWKNIAKGYKYEINRAKKISSNIVVKNYDKEEVDQFQKIYNAMFVSKHMRNRFNYNLVRDGLLSGNVIITVGRAVDVCSYHAYLVDGKNALLMYSASSLWNTGMEQSKKNLIGYTNKGLHWFDILYFKSLGYVAYDWGGIGEIENPSGISKFKMSFGGKVWNHYIYIIAKSWLGIAYLLALKWKNRK